MIRICTATAAYVGTCDHCIENQEPTPYSPQQVITVVSLHRGGSIVFIARFCERHFLRFSDLVSDQVAALLYPKP